jgi:hypothetical protein
MALAGGPCRVTIDGSKFKAVNTRDKNFTRIKVKRRRAQLEESVARYLVMRDQPARQPHHFNIPSDLALNGVAYRRFEPAVLIGSTRNSRRHSVVEPVMVRQSPRAPGRVLWGRRAAARSVPAWVVTSGPTAFDPTGSAPLPPAATSVGDRLNGTSSYSQSSNSRLRERKRKHPIRQ